MLGAPLGWGGSAPRSPRKEACMLLKTILPPLAASGAGALGAGGCRGSANAPRVAAAGCKEVEKCVGVQQRGGTGRGWWLLRRARWGTPRALLRAPPQRQDRARGCRDPAILFPAPGTDTPGCELRLKQTRKRLLELRLQRAGAPGSETCMCPHGSSPRRWHL